MHLNKTQTPASTDLGEMLRSPRTPESRGQGGIGGIDFASHVQALRREPMQERAQTQNQTPPRAEAPRTPERTASAPAPAPSAQDSRAATPQKAETAAADDETAQQTNETGPRSKLRTAAKPGLTETSLAAAIKPEAEAQAALDADPTLQLGEELLAEEAPQDAEVDADALAAALNPNTAPVAPRPESLAPKTAAAKPAADAALKEALSALEATGAGQAASEPAKKTAASATSAAQEAHAEAAAAAPTGAAGQALPPSTAALVSSMNSSQTSKLAGFESRRGEAGVGAATPLHSASQAATLGAAGAGSAEPSSASASLATPPGAPGFSEELGTQMLVWLKAGVQQAELRLNPADMGPVQVRIHLDGQQAQVQFGAEQAQTREALEASLPELARALEREGLQWQGGGVQSQLQQQQQQQRQPAGEAPERSADGSSSRRGAAETLSPAAAQPRALRGLVDLYA